MKNYLDACRLVLEQGELRKNRTGVDTLSVFGGVQSRYDLREGFPAVTTKKLQFSSVVKELLWFLRGETNISTLDSHIWDEWADEYGELNYCYGKMWRKYPIGIRHGYGQSVDQIDNLIKGIIANSDSRRHIICAWHPGLVEYASLPWCHVLTQFNVTEDYVDCLIYQRSADLCLGIPFNIASYSLLLSMVARRVNRLPRYFTHVLGDAHIYVNHIEGLKEQLAREPLPLPYLVLLGNPEKELWNYEESDIKLEGYKYHPAIAFKVAV